jgi:ubiquinone/menaquinone biosynthesis C-methylase UbiE
LPYPTGCFDRVVSSLVMDHQTVADKQRTFVEARRVLRPGGELHILDFGRPHNFYTRVMAGIMRHFEETAAQFDGFLPEMLAQSGFTQVKEMQRFTTIVGPLVSLKAISSETKFQASRQEKNSEDSR